MIEYSPYILDWAAKSKKGYFGALNMFSILWYSDVWCAKYD